MMHAIGVALAAKLLEKGCPIPVIDGPEPTTTTTWSRERIVIERDTQAGDGFGPARGGGVNPSPIMARTVAGKITIFAKSSKRGALPFEHDVRADLISDQVVVAMHFVMKDLTLMWQPRSSRLVKPADLQASEKQGGAVCEIAFVIERTVTDTAWDGSIADEIEITGAGNAGDDTGVVVTTTSRVTRDGVTYEEVSNAE